MKTKKTAREWIIMLTVCGSMIVVTGLVRNALTGWDLADIVETVDEPSVCWFLSPTVEAVLSADLIMWTAHLEHNPSALMSEWYDLRLTEVTALYTSKGITESEAAACLDNLIAIEEELP